MAAELSADAVAAILNTYTALTVDDLDARAGLQQKTEYVIDDLDDAIERCWRLRWPDRLLCSRRWHLAMVALESARLNAAHLLDHCRDALKLYEITGLEMYLRRASIAAAANSSWRTVRREEDKPHAPAQ